MKRGMKTAGKGGKRDSFEERMGERRFLECKITGKTVSWCQQSFYHSRYPFASGVLYCSFLLPQILCVQMDQPSSIDSHSSSRTKRYRSSIPEYLIDSSLSFSRKPYPLEIPSEFLIPSKIKYSIVDTLGKGSFGSVIKVITNDKKPRTYAVKRFVKTKFHDQIGEILSTIREIHALHYFQHPNLLHAFQIQSGPYSSIECFLPCAKCDLRMLTLSIYGKSHLLVQIPQSVVKYIIYQCTLGIEYLHKIGFIHRDIKAGNILCFSDGSIKLGDFGLVRSFGVQPFSIFGSLIEERCFPNPMSPNVQSFKYRAPEVLSQSDYSQSIDIWSLGILMYFLSFGEFPFNGTSDSDQILQITGLLRTKNISTQPSNLSNAPLFPPLFDILGTHGIDLLSKLCAVDPNIRPSASDILRHPYFSTDPKPSLSSFIDCIKGFDKIKLFKNAKSQH